MMEDKAVRYAVLSRIVGVSLGPLVLFSVGAFLNPEEQGLYYVFGSLLQLRLFVDLGFSRSALQMVSHVFGNLHFSKKGKLTGESDRIQKFLEISKFTCKVYFWIGIITFLGIGIAGYLYLARNVHAQNISWQSPWWVMITSLGLFISSHGILVVAEGANRIELTNKWRFISDIIAIITFIAILRFGGGLWASAVQSFVRSLILIVPIGYELGGCFLGGISRAASSSVNYKRQVLPLQFRNMITYSMGFLTFYMYSPMSLSLKGAVTAGVVGMSLQITNMVQSLSAVWFDTKIPLMGNLAGCGQKGELKKIHEKGTRVTIVSWLIVVSLAILGAASCKFLQISFGSRFGSVSDLVLFFTGSACFLWVHLRGSLIRAHQMEPFAIIAMFQAIGTLILLWIGIPRFGVTGAAATYAITMTGGAIWAEFIYRAHLSKFHVEKDNV